MGGFPVASPVRRLGQALLRIGHRVGLFGMRVRPWALIPVLAIALALSAGPKIARAHPHLFLDATVEAQMRAGAITGFKVSWTYDDALSAMLIEDFDSNRDRRFSGHELEKLHRDVFLPSADFGYYLQVQAGDRHDWVKDISQFSAGIDGGRVWLSFHAALPSGLAGDPRRTAISLALWDEEMMVALVPPEPQPVAFAGEGAAGCEAKQILERAVPWPDGLYKLFRIDLLCR